MKKMIFKRLISVCLALLCVIGLSSCAVKQPIDKYEDGLSEVCEAEGFTYETKSIDYRNKKEAAWKEAFEIETEIDRMFVVKDSEGGEQAVVIKFYKESHAKKYAKAYEKEMKIDFFAKLERVKSLIGGEYEGELLDIFRFDYKCERDGDILVYGSTDLVSKIVDAK